MTAPDAVDVRRNLAYHISGMRSASESGGLTLSATAAASLADKLGRIAAAVAELIAADREYDSARAALAIYSDDDPEDLQEREYREAAKARLRTASARRAAALARCGGAQ